MIGKPLSSVQSNGSLVTQPVETAVVAECQALGISFLYGAPNESHYKFGKPLLKYRDLVQISILHKRLNVMPGYCHLGPFQPALSWLNHLTYAWASQTRCRKTAGDVTTLMADHFDERFDRLWEQASKAYEILAVRDRRFLEWRYGDNPRKRHVCLAAVKHDDVLGYLILTFMTVRSARVGVIADVFSLSDDAVVDALLHSAVLWCLNETVDYMRCGALARTHLYRALRRAGFSVKRRAKPVVYVPFEQVNEDIFHDPTQWYLTLGDFDFDE